MKSYSKLLLPSIYVGAIIVMVMSTILVLSGINNYLNEKIEYDFTLDNVFEGQLSPVVKTKSNNIIRPYTLESVKVGKYFYDFESDQSKQEESIVYYENTYMQNNGVDYVSEEIFDVVSILDGEIISIEENEVYGKVLTIKHNDNLKSVYSNITDVLVSVGYKVSQGEIIAASKEANYNTKDKSLLHFEVYFNGNAIDPENLYNLTVSELR